MTKTANQLTVGILIKKLECISNKRQEIAFCQGLYPSGFWSYRGYYEDLAIGITTFPTTVGQWTENIKKQIGERHEGWKGGIYSVKEGTALWAAVQRRDTGHAITDVKQKDGWLQLCLTNNWAANEH